MSNTKTERRGRKRNDDLIRRRKEEILHSASRVFAQFGYADTDVDRVALELDISKGTIYRYFPSKKELFLAALDREIQRLREHVAQASMKDENPLLQIARAVEAYLAFFHENPHVVELLMQERAKFRDREDSTYLAQRNTALNHWKGLLEKLVAKGYFRPMPVERMLDMLANMIYGAIFLNHFHQDRGDLSTQAHDILDVLVNGLATKVARDELSVDDAKLKL